MVVWVAYWPTGLPDGMESLQVCRGEQGSSKTSSRSASPCPTRPRSGADLQQLLHQNQSQFQKETPQQPPTQRSVDAQSFSQPHHSHGSSLDSTKSHEGIAKARHRSPTQQRHRSPTHRHTEEPGTPSRDRDHHMEETIQPPCDINVEEQDYSSFLSNGSAADITANSSQIDGVIGSENVGSIKTQQAIEHLNKKMTRVRENIRLEQAMRDENVNEYLKLATNADKQQLARIKAVFEKKNQKSAHVISQWQRKLDSYSKKMRELEEQRAGEGINQSSHRPPREVLRDMGQGLKNVGGNIRDGITGFSGTVMSKPREFAHLIKNKFGSADNINHLSTWYIGAAPDGQSSSSDRGQSGTGHGSEGSGTERIGIQTTSTEERTTDRSGHHGSATLPATLGHSGTSGASQGSGGHAKFPSDEGSECSSVTSESLPGYHGRSRETGPQGVYSLKPLFTELQELREGYDRLREKLDGYKSLNQEVQYLSSALQEERFRLERLEEQINDLTELHQNEVENLKQALADMEEKVQYQSEERLRDIHEMLEHCQTKMQKMEHQALQQQQYVTLEGLDNSNARALVVKLINILLTVLQVILLLVATVAGITMPFLRTRVRFLSTIILIFAMLFVLKQWPEVRDIGSHVMHHIKDMLDPVK